MSGRPAAFGVAEDFLVESIGVCVVQGLEVSVVILVLFGFEQEKWQNCSIDVLSEDSVGSEESAVLPQNR